MDCKDKVKNLMYYLLSIKSMDEDTIKNINSYENIYWEVDLANSDKNCVMKEDNNGTWFVINKSNKKLYDSFFELYISIQKNNSDREILWGNYILTWENENKKIIHPLITRELKLHFDAENGRFLLKPCSEKYKMEFEIFKGLDIPNISEILKIKEKIDTGGINFRNIKEARNVLNSIVHYLSSDVNPSGEIRSSNKMGEIFRTNQYPMIYNMPSVIIKKRDHNLWRNEIINILKQIDSGAYIPPTVKAIVNSEKIMEDERTSLSFNKLGENLLFPLKSNKEQRMVADKLSKNYGVVVDGPPGTGKSQTIANLICDLLAHGKKVLVTSQTGRSLKVLSSKLPEGIRPLCISLLDDDAKSLAQLDDAVRIITEKLSLDPALLKADILELRDKLKNCKLSQEELYKKLEQVYDMENSKVNVNGKLVSLMDISKWLKENSMYSFIGDDIKFEDKCPLTDEQFLKFIKLLGIVDNKELLQKSKTKFIKQIPNYDEINNKIIETKKLKQTYDQDMDNLKGLYMCSDKEIDYVKLLSIINNAKNKMDKIKGSWLQSVMKDYYSSEIVRPVLKHVYMRSRVLIRDLSDIKRMLTVHIIKIPEDKSFEDFKADFKNIYDLILKKGTIKKMFRKMHREYKYIFENCSVDGNPICKRDEAEIINLYIQGKDIEKEFMELWNSNMMGYKAFEIKKFNINSLMALEKSVNDIGMVIDWNMDYRNKISDVLENMVFLNRMDWYKPETYDYLKKTVISLKNVNDYIKDSAFLNGLKKICLFIPELKQLENAIEKLDEMALKEAYVVVLKLKENQKYIDDINMYYDKLYNTVPKFTDKIMSNCNRESFKEFNKAWNFRKLQCLVNRAHKVSSGLIERLIKEEKKKESIIIEKLVSKSAWYRQIKCTTDSQKRNLYAWIQAVKKTGRSRSRFLYKYRDLAQKEMEQCRDSIPVWIMPVNKIIENIKLTKNLFDVIIFDESSQCDIFSICALFRAKRAVIVGDDRQITPQIIGVDQEKVNKLIERYLYEIPNRESLDLETSLYSTALRVFPERVVLKEHFRCLPQIIGFSNNLCYANEIIPLRYENKTLNFRSPIKAVKVEDGAKDKAKNINMNEAKSIVQAIIDCCIDYRYKNMTMGVISLLGNDQAQLIENMLLQKLGKTEMEKRKLMCGEPYSFQGDERDIIFLSMVVSDDVKFTAFTREIDYRRFNVAVTRARDQLWLFYSISAENLNPDCVRSKLIKYCTETSNKKEGTLIPQYFENDFLRDVYNSIKNRGYNIVYYENLNKYNIDFVIEGDNKIAAIICNGGKNRTKEDTKTVFERQLNLEQSGWLFFTIDGSEFYENKPKVMDKLQEKLNYYGIDEIKKSNIKEKSIEISIK